MKRFRFVATFFMLKQDERISLKRGIFFVQYERHNDGVYSFWGKKTECQYGKVAQKRSKHFLTYGNLVLEKVYKYYIMRYKFIFNNILNYS